MNSKDCKSLLILFLLSIPSLASALPFTIAPKAGTSLPTQIIAGQTINAYYTIKNNTNRLRTGNYLKYLPKNVAQVTNNSAIPDLCGSTFTLQASNLSGDSCTLQLLISGAVNGASQNPNDHLFACFPGGKTCAGTTSPLNITLIPTASTVIAGGFYVDQFDNQVIGLTTSTDNGASWTTETLTPPTGYHNGSINGISSAMEFSVGSGYYLDTNDTPYPTIIRRTAQNTTWQQQILSSLDGISCTGRDCIATGFAANPTTNKIEALIASSVNSGLTWTQQTLPELAGYTFTKAIGVSCTGSTCVSVGYISDGMQVQSWAASTNNNGASWSQQALPNLANIEYQQLLDVSCTSSECIAVGEYDDSNGVSHPGIAITTDNGATWSQQILDILSPFSQSYYSGISCTSSYCVAVGFNDTGTGSNHTGYPAVAITTVHGISWSQQSLTVPSGFTYGELTSVRCSNTTCQAAGFYQSSSGVTPFTATSLNSGQTWTQTPNIIPSGYVEGAFNAIG